MNSVSAVSSRKLLKSQWVWSDLASSRIKIKLNQVQPIVGTLLYPWFLEKLSNLSKYHVSLQKPLRKRKKMIFFSSKSLKFLFVCVGIYCQYTSNTILCYWDIYANILPIWANRRLLGKKG